MSISHADVVVGMSALPVTHETAAAKHFVIAGKVFHRTESLSTPVGRGSATPARNVVSSVALHVLTKSVGFRA